MNNTIPVAQGISIWLKFGKNYELILQNLIDELALKFKSSVFTPHITLFKGLEKNELEIVSLLNTFCIDVYSFKVEIKKLTWEKNFYKSFFAEIEINNSLLSIYQRGLEIFQINSNEIFLPHVSLIYANLEEEVKEKIKEEISEKLPRELSIDKIAVVKTQGLPIDWREIISVIL